MDARVVAETEQRYGHRREVRRVARTLIDEGRLVEADTPARVAARIERLSAGAPTARDTVGLERILGTNDLTDFRFLGRGAVRGAGVARVVIQRGPGVVEGYGTGVLVTSRLLMTNNHVLADAGVAQHSTAEFGYELDDAGVLAVPEVVRLEPATFFFTDAALDVTVVAVAAATASGRAVAGFGWSPLVGVEGKVIIGEWLNIIQHPSGDPKAVALRENRLVDVLEDFLHYETDTAPGSSGSPVYNDQWELVALHHSGVPDRDAEGRILTVQGEPWTPALGDAAVRWKANEGVRVSRIVQRLRALQLPAAQAALRDDAVAGRPPAPVPPGAVPATAPLTGVGAVGVAIPEGTVAVTIPLQVTVQIGAVPVASSPSTVPPGVAMGGGVAVGAPARPGDADGAATTVAAALAELDQARRRTYYDATADRRDRRSYYAGVTAGFEALSELVRRTHTTTPRYLPLREVYPWVDLHPDGTLRSVYSGVAFAPETLIAQDARTAERRAAEVVLREATMAPSDLDAFLEATLPYNCEHAVPQSWFAGREPMRGDLHHLFTCESGCNSFRGNTPYDEFDDLEEVVRNACGRREAGRFEPVAGKGAVARATLYVLLRYPDEVSIGELPADRVPVLLQWHAADPPGPWERHRNQAIYARQGNRNPFIDHPAWAAKVDFTAAGRHEVITLR